MFTEAVRRRVGLTMAFFLFAVFVMIAAIVVPQVATDTSRGAEPMRAAVLFAGAAILHALLGMSVLWSRSSAGGALSIAGRSSFANGIPVRTGVFGLFLGIMLLDAALDLGKRVPALPAADASLFVCACGDLACAGLIFVMAFARSRTAEESSSKPHSPVGMTALSAILGLFSPLVFLLGGALFEGGGGDSLKEVLAGCVAMALYLALCQFLVARSAHSAGRTRAVWSSSFAAMIAPLPVWALAIAVIEKSGVVRAQDLPLLFAGCTGCLAGALAARWAPGSQGAHGVTALAACRIALRVAGGLLIVVAALLFFVIAPIVAKDTAPEATPGPATRAFMVIAAFHLLLAGFSFWKTRSVAMPVASGVFGLVFGLFLLFMASVFSQHGPSVHPAVIALYACAASDLLAGCSATAVATVGRGEPAPAGL